VVASIAGFIPPCALQKWNLVARMATRIARP
jgi:hypothetical protein